MSDVEVGTKRSKDYDEYGEISYKKSRSDKQKMRFLLVGKCCGAIIGKGGENIKRLRNEYGVHVNLPDTRSSERVLTLQGDRDSCVAVVKDIVTSYKEGNNRNRGPDTNMAPFDVDPKKKCTHEINLLAPSDQVGAVIGRGGKKIKEIREESGGKVKVYQDCLPNSNERIVAIGGDDESRLLAAFNIVLDVLRDHPQKMHSTIYYDPKNKNNDEQSSGGNQFGALGAGLGGLSALGGLSGLAAGAATLLGQLGVGTQTGAGLLGAQAGGGILGGQAGGGILGAHGGGGILGAAGSFSNLLGSNRNNRENTSDNRGSQYDNQAGQFDNRNGQFDNRGGQFDNRGSQFDNRGSQCDNRGSQLDNRNGHSGGFGEDRSSGFGTSHNASAAFGQYNNSSNVNRDNRNGFSSDDRDRGDFSQMQTVIKVTVSNDMCGAIIGKSGQRIKEIRQSTGVKVDFTETEKGSREDRVITITGTQKQTIAAQEMMTQCVRNRNM